MANERARSLRKDMTEAERRLWSRLRRRAIDGHHFRRQRPIGPFVVDFVCLKQRLVIEVDGGQHADNVVRDAHRTVFLERQGFRVLRFWNSDVLAQTDSVAETIRTALTESPPPYPPPRGVRAGEGEE